MNAPEDFSKEKVDVLKKMCKERGLNGYSKLKKSELIDLLINGTAASGSASALPSQPTAVCANDPRIVGSLTAPRASHTIGNPSSSASSAASPTCQQISKPGNPTSPNFVVQSAPSAASVQDFETLHKKHYGSDAQVLASSPKRLSELEASIAAQTPNQVLGCKDPSKLPSVAAPGYPDEHDDTVHSIPAQPSTGSTPLSSNLFRAKNGQALPVAERKRNGLLPRAADHAEPKAKRQKVLSKGKASEVFLDQEILDSHLMPPPQLIPFPRPAPKPVPPHIGANPAAPFPLPKQNAVSHQRQGDALADGGVPLPPVPLVNAAHRTLTGGSLQLQSSHTPISGYCCSSNTATATCTLIAIKPLVFKNSKAPAPKEPPGRRNVQAQSVLLASLDRMIRPPEAVQITRESYENSFLSPFFTSYFDDFSPIADHLWSNPDHPLQATVAIRFVLSRLFLALGSGMVREWSTNQVFSTGPLEKSQDIWKIEVQDTKSKPPSRALFYILASTGEVIGRPLETEILAAFDLPIRSDWSSFLDSSCMENEDKRSLPLLFHFVRWQNAEEYEHGISKAWLNRLATDPDALSKFQVAQRYIMANVVPNR
ncbi:hypothetical protein FRC01_001017 [Tulasnella sp. 417]|nr:hypothetical protein FRC01_001017 [Tulasnella sp. 417]